MTGEIVAFIFLHLITEKIRMTQNQLRRRQPDGDANRRRKLREGSDNARQLPPAQRCCPATLRGEKKRGMNDTQCSFDPAQLFRRRVSGIRKRQ
jgi:hypothetical protein